MRSQWLKQWRIRTMKKMSKNRWRSLEKTCRLAKGLSYLSLQDAARKRRDGSQKPGAWAGSVCHCDTTGRFQRSNSRTLGENVEAHTMHRKSIGPTGSIHEWRRNRRIDGEDWFVRRDGEVPEGEDSRLGSFTSRPWNRRRGFWYTWSWLTQVWSRIWKVFTSLSTLGDPTMTSMGGRSVRETLSKLEITGRHQNLWEPPRHATPRGALWTWVH